MHTPPSTFAHAVGEAMHRGVIKCRAETSALAVARMMAAHSIHSVLVVGDEGTCSGVVSDRELELALSSGAPGSIRASDIAVAPVIVDPADTLAHALVLMHDSAATHLVVSESRTNRVVGVLSVLDVADAFSNKDGS
jgi:CBS domain-containing protein